MEKNKIIDRLTNFFKVNADVKNDDSILIISDEIIDNRILHYLTDSAKTFTNQVSSYLIKDYTNNNHLSSTELIKKVQQHSLILAPTSRTLFHTALIQDACKNDTMFFAMTGAKLETLYKGGATAEFKQIEHSVKKLTDLITKAEQIEITSPKGTGIKGSIKNRIANGETGLGVRGRATTFPDIEVNTSFIEDTVNGVIIVDASVGGMGVLENEVIKLTVRNGKIIDIEGTTFAEKLTKQLNDFNDANVYQIAEIGIGMNPNSSITGVIIEDESTLGTGHFGIGNNIFMGGQNDAKTHMDFVFYNPTIFLDGEKIVEGKQHFY